jgi:hypothetical protein
MASIFENCKSLGGLCRGRREIDGAGITAAISRGQQGPSGGGVCRVGRRGERCRIHVRAPLSLLGAAVGVRSLGRCSVSC